MGSKKLTAKQKMFCKEYLIDLNATQAAIRAGYSEKTAGVIGDENLKKPYISAEIQRLMNKRSDRLEISADSILKDIEETRDLCAEYMLIKNENGDVIGIDNTALQGRIKSNDQLGKHKKLFTDKVEHSGSIDLTTKSKLINKYLEGDED